MIILCSNKKIRICKYLEYVTPSVVSGLVTGALNQRLDSSSSNPAVGLLPVVPAHCKHGKRCHDLAFLELYY